MLLKNGIWWTPRNQVRSGRTSNEKPYNYNLPRVRRNLGLSDLSLAEKKKSIHCSKPKDRHPWEVNRMFSMQIPNAGPGDTGVSPDCTGSALILSVHSDRKTCSYIS